MLYYIPYIFRYHIMSLRYVMSYMLYDIYIISHDMPHMGAARRSPSRGQRRRPPPTPWRWRLWLRRRLRQAGRRVVCVPELHDKDLKATVASMKAGAKARFSKVIDIAEYREFWRKGKRLLSSKSVVL